MLLVDDHEDSTIAMRVLLEVRGVRVVTAQSARAALEAAQVQRFQVALLDLKLPDMPGDELLGRLRALPGMHECRYVCVSGRGLDPDERRHMGFDHYLTKPVDMEQLERLLSDRV